MNAIELKSINKSYKTFEISDISFNIPTGSIVGLVGENGAGKSTLIKLIMNAISKDSGKIKVLGVENTTKDFLEIKQDVGVVLDEAYFPYTIDAKKLNSIIL